MISLEYSDFVEKIRC